MLSNFDVFTSNSSLVTEEKANREIRFSQRTVFESQAAKKQVTLRMLKVDWVTRETPSGK